MDSNDTGRTLRVGLLVTVALIVLAAGIFLLGDKANLFTAKNEYYSLFPSVEGLNPGNPVQLNGVEVGTVQTITLPESPGEREIRVDLAIDQRYSGRIRSDSIARIKTLGLLGDKYVQVTTGSPGADEIPSGSEIPVSSPPGMEALMASGQDVITDVNAIAGSLRRLLSRVEQGEGVVGELVADQQAGVSVIDSILQTLESVQQMTDRIEHGDGTVPRLLTDADLADRVESSVAKMETFLTRMEEGEGLVPALMTDVETRQRFEKTLASLERSSANLATFTDEIRAGEGVLPKLLFDEEYGDRVTEDLEQLLGRLNLVATELEGGDGTAAKLINDPEVYQALNDIIIGVNESRMLRWLIRNRQKKGIETRYEEVQEDAGEPVDEELYDPDEIEDPENPEGSDPREPPPESAAETPTQRAPLHPGLRR